MFFIYTKDKNIELWKRKTKSIIPSNPDTIVTGKKCVTNIKHGKKTTTNYTLNESIHIED